MSSRISKRIKFRDRPDIFNGKYFIITFPYGLFYLIGAAVGYSKTSNLFCLLISGFIGIMFIILSIAHAIDYYAGASISSFYVSIPFIVSMFVGIFMTCFWAMGSRFKSSAVVACVAWPCLVFYCYAIIKDYSDGTGIRRNTWRALSKQEDTNVNNNRSYDSRPDSKL